MKKTSLKMLSLILSVLVTVQVFYAPLYASAENEVSTVSQDETAGFSNAAEQTDGEVSYGADGSAQDDGHFTVLREVPELREQCVKHFELSNGKMMAAEYQVPVHFEQDGKWADIDNSLVEETSLSDSSCPDGKADERSSPDRRTAVEREAAQGESSIEQEGAAEATASVEKNSAESGSTSDEVTAKDGSPAEEALTDNEQGYANTENSFKIKFAKKSSSKKLVKIKKDGYQLSWGINRAKNKSIRVEAAEKKSENGQKDPTVPDKLSSSVTYPDVFDGVDFEYSVISDFIKENIVLKKRLSSYSFEFSLSSEKLTPELKDNTVEFKNKGGEVVFIIPAPFMYDAAGEQSQGVTLAINQGKNKDEYILTVTPDKQWIDRQDRQFPVVIDPVIQTTVTYQNGFSSGYVFRCSNGTLGKNTTTQHMYVGEITEGLNAKSKAYIKYTLPTLKEGDKVCEAYMGICQYFNSTPSGGDATGIAGGKFRINVHKITEQWVSGDISWDTAYDPAPMDSQNTDCLFKGWDSFNITRAVKEWYDGKQNNGIMFVANEYKNGDARRYVTKDAGSEYGDYRPQLIVVYLNTTGLNDFNSYKTYDMGHAGTAYINEYTGKVTHIVEDIAYQSNFPTVEIRHVNNTARKDAQEGYGKGWSLNICESVALIPQSSGLASKYKIKYRDEDGTEIYFLENGSTTNLKDEVGRGMTLLMPSGSATTYTITMKDGTKKVFDSWGSLYEIQYTDGKKTTIGLSNHKPVSVTDFAGRAATLTYGSDGLLTEISATSNRKINYTYSSGKLTKISLYNGLESTFAYTSDNALKEVYDGDLCFGMQYSGGKLEAVYEAPHNTGAKYVMWAEYFTDKTLFTHPGPSAKIDSQASDRFYQHCLFNSYGQKISDYVTNAYLTDSSMTPEFYGVECNEYSPVLTEGSLSRNNKLLTSYAANDAANLLSDPSFEKDNGSWSSSSDFSYNSDSSKAYAGNKSGKFYRSSNGPQKTVYQTVNLPAGTYTFSAYVKAESLSGGAFGVAKSNGGLTLSGSGSCKITSPSIQWQRLFTTFELETRESVNVGFVLEEDVRGPIYVDCAQLTRGESPSAPNLLENSNMEKSSVGWTASSTVTGQDGYKANSSDNLFKTSYRLSGDLTTDKYFYQDIPVMGSPTDTYILSGWAKGSSLPEKSQTSDGQSVTNNSRFDVEITVTYTNGTTQKIDGLKFDRYNRDWQFLTKCFTVAHKTNSSLSPKSIRVACNYFKNSGEALFDNIQLIKDATPSYTYDDDGNIVSVKDLAKQRSEYDFRNNKVVSALNPTGSRFVNVYSSDDKNELKASESDGVTYAYSYDSTRNVTSARSIASAFKKDVFFHIVTTQKNYVLDLSNNQGADGTAVKYYPPHFANNQTFRFVQKDTTAWYTIRPYSHPNKVLGCKNGGTSSGTEIVLQSYTGADSQLWKVDKNSDGTYRFTPKHAQSMRLDAPDPYSGSSSYRSLIIYSSNSGKAQKFTLMAKNDTSLPYSEATATYDQKGVHIKTVSDMDGVVAEYSYGDSDKLFSLTGRTSTTMYISPDDELNYAVWERGKNDTNLSAKVHYCYTGKNLTKIISPGATYNFEYDAFGNRTKTKVGSTALMTNTYMADNRSLSESVYGNGDSIDYKYDKFGRNIEVIKTTASDSSEDKASWKYDGFGNISQMTDNASGTAFTTDYIYDSIGRISSFNRNDGYGADVAYDTYNRIKDIRYKTVDGSRGVSYNYNNDTNLIDTATYDGYELNYFYDGLNRLKRRAFIVTSPSGVMSGIHEKFFYRTSGNRTDSRVTSHSFNNILMWYEYDTSGNITKITDSAGNIRHEYTYDDLGRLKTEINMEAGNQKTTTVNGKKIVYTYSSYGDVLQRQYFNVQRGPSGFIDSSTSVRTDRFGYTNLDWRNQCDSTNINGVSSALSYDAIGNPLTYRDGMQMTWQNGRQLKELTAPNGKMLRFSYDINGQRQTKVERNYGNVVHTTKYFYDGTKLAGEKKDDTIVWYDYDENGSPVGMRVNGLDYIFRKNLQGDITGIYNSSTELIVEYTYSDAWGAGVTVSGSAASTIGMYNSFRYRGYYYDTESGLYYLNSRYYDPVACRFINADGVISTDQGANGYNMYSYCKNNPVNMSDDSGQWPQWLKRVARAVAGTVAKIKAAISIPTTIVKIGVASSVAVVSGKATVGDVINDAKNYRFYNSSEKKVLNSKVFSSYKGTPVLKHNVSSISSFSISNTIFLNKSENLSTDGINTVKHEWGHTVQQSLIGTSKYISKIAIPSMIGYLVNPSSKAYYSLPWERSADFFGDVNRSTGYYDGSEELAGLYLIMP